MIFTCDKCAAVLRLADSPDFAEATAEHQCWLDTVDLDAGEATFMWVLKGVKNPEKYALKGPAFLGRVNLGE